jgi:enediyne biosynthesis protein E3
MGNDGFSRRIRKLAFRVPPSAAEFARRGFECRNARARDQLERIGRTAIEGFNVALDDTAPDRLGARLKQFDREYRGYAFEGASIALTLLDCLTPWRKDRVRRFLEGPGAAFAEIVHTGIGFTLARLHRRVERALPKLDSVMGWLAVDGYGLHEGYYHWPRYARGSGIQGRFSAATLRVFDQGLGRSLWFTQCADVETIAAAISEFSPERGGNLWAGVGLACAYTGVAERADIESLRRAAGTYLPQLAEGATFAARARQRGGNLTAQTSLACEVLCGKSADEAAALANEVLATLPTEGIEPPYEMWRRLVRARYQPATSPMVTRS